MDALWRDLRAGARALARSPGFTAVAIISLALGIGVNSAVFSIVYSTVVDILPWKDPERIVVVYETRRSEGEIRQSVSTAKYVDWKDQVRSYDGGLVATSQTRLNLTDGDDLVAVNTGETTANAFSSLGLRMQLGRGFHPSETELRAGRVAILSHQLWQRRYESDPQIVGSSIEIDGQPVPVVGVLGESEWFPFPDSELVTPLVLDPADLSERKFFTGLLVRAPMQTSGGERSCDLRRYPFQQFKMLLVVRPNFCGNDAQDPNNLRLRSQRRIKQRPNARVED